MADNAAVNLALHSQMVVEMSYFTIEDLQDIHNRLKMGTVSHNDESRLIALVSKIEDMISNYIEPKICIIERERK